MPGRILPGDLGDNLLEMTLPYASLMSYPWLTRATDNYGCCRYIPALIHAKAFSGKAPPHAPELTDIDTYIKDLIKAGLVEKWKAKNGLEYIFFTRWFRDNSFMVRTKPTTPRPPSLARLITEAAWKSGDETAFRPIYFKSKKVQKSLVNSTLDSDSDSDRQEEKTQEYVTTLFEHYKTVTGKPKAKLLPEYVTKIKTRLKLWKVEELQQAITNHWSTPWRRKHLHNKSIGWIMRSNKAIDELLQMKPEMSGDPAMQIDEEPGGET